MILTIIIPVYNVESYLTECLDSIFLQDLDDCEIITVNDGSTDNSRKILLDYQTKYPELQIIDQTNGGLSIARNAGLKIANSEYVYFLDSDDYLLPGAIKQIIQSIEKGKSEVIGFNATANGNAVYIPSLNVENFVKSGINFYVDFYNNNGFYPFVNVPIYVYRKFFLEQHNLTFQEGLYHEDILFSLQVFYFANSICCFNIPIFNYRQHRVGSICTEVKLKNLVDKAVICRSLDEFFLKNKFDNIYFYNSLFKIYIGVIMESIAYRHKKKQYLFFNKKDVEIMRRGVISKNDFKFWVLALINKRLMGSYYINTLPSILRRIINILFSFITKFYKLK